MKKLFQKLLAVSFLFTCFLFVGTDVEAADTIHNGIFIENVDVSGMTTSQAMDAMNSYVTNISQVQIVLNAADGHEVTTTAGALGLTWKNTGIVEDAASYGKKGNIVQRYKAMEDLSYENKTYNIEFAINTDAITQLINDQCLQYDMEAIDAKLHRENGAFVVEAGQTGYKVDVAASVSTISNFLASEWNHEAADIDLTVAVDQPRGTADELAKVKDVLGTYTTDFHTSAAARTANVRNGCSLINGTTVYPGDTFSAYEAVSPFTEENGYYLAGSYLNGMVVESLGGGICQVSTTLYNAVLLSELEVKERFNHSMIVSYVPPSADAAISGTSKDFKFVNNSQYPIYIEGSTSPDKKITFTIYGVESRAAGHEVSYESEVLTTKNPEGEKIIADAAQPVGYVDVQSAHIGYTAKLWKVVKEDGVEVSRTEVNKSSYAMAPRTATVGVSTANVDVYNAMQAAIATGNIDYVRGLAAQYNAAQAPPAVNPEAPASTTPVTLPDITAPGI